MPVSSSFTLACLLPEAKLSLAESLSSGAKLSELDGERVARTEKTKRRNTSAEATEI